MRGILSALSALSIYNTMPTFIFRFICTLPVTFAYLFTCASAIAQQQRVTKQFNIGIHVIKAEIAATQAQRQIGLMNRQQMGQNEGMMFIFDRPNNHCMWMKNTLIPLSVAFIDNDGVIVNIEEMKPQTEVNHCASKPVRFALEMNAQWFKQKGIQPGSKISGLGAYRT